MSATELIIFGIYGLVVVPILLVPLICAAVRDGCCYARGNPA